MLNTSTINNDLLTIKMAEAYMKCSHVLLWRLRKQGLIKTVMAGKKILITKSSIDAYLQIDTKEEVNNG